MGYDDPISTNPAMVLGGLEIGVTPLGWTYAYSTHRQRRRPGQRHPGAAPRRQPGLLHPGHRQGRPDDQGRRQRLHARAGARRRAPPKKRSGILETVVSSGTGTNAHIGAEGQWGKTGTTENNGDAWFCGGDQRRSDRLRLGRLPGLDDADDHALQRRPGRGRHLPGPDLGQRDLGLGGDPGRARGREGGARSGAGGRRGRSSPSEYEPYVPPESGSEYEAAPEAEESDAGAGSRRSRARSRSRAGSRPKPHPKPRRNPAVAAAASPPASGSTAAAARRSGCRRRRSARAARPLW